jgi:hypothetical protein
LVKVPGVVVSQFANPRARARGRRPRTSGCCWSEKPSVRHSHSHTRVSRPQHSLRAPLALLAARLAKHRPIRNPFPAGPHFAESAVGIPAATQKANPTLSFGPVRPVRQHRVASYRRARPAGNITSFPRQPLARRQRRLESLPAGLPRPAVVWPLTRASRHRRPFTGLRVRATPSCATPATRNPPNHCATLRDHTRPSESHAHPTGECDSRTSALRTLPVVPELPVPRPAGPARRVRRPTPPRESQLRWRGQLTARSVNETVFVANKIVRPSPGS